MAASARVWSSQPWPRDSEESGAGAGRVACAPLGVVAPKDTICTAGQRRRRRREARVEQLLHERWLRIELTHHGEAPRKLLTRQQPARDRRRAGVGIPAAEERDELRGAVARAQLHRAPHRRRAHA